MKVNSQNTEFGYELISAIPYAYYLHSEGLLTETESAVDTKCLYYFSPKHIENKKKRSFFNTPKAKNIPNIDIHKPYLNKGKFLAPPLKEKYENDRFVFEKELVIICNRKNKEWNENAINYFDVETLSEMFTELQEKYQIVYVNIEGKTELYDNEKPISLGDYELIRNDFSDTVINIHDLHSNNSDLSFNELQLMLFANCQKFITMNGGHSILASYFGGENIIMSKYGDPQAKELNSNVNSFYRWYNEFGDSRIIHVPDEKSLLKKINSLWVKEDPICNILVRTTNRPHAFSNCVESIYKQDYQNINIFVSFETIEDFKYIVPEKCYAYHVKPNKKIAAAPQSEKFGVKFHANLYLNELQDKVRSGFVMYLDDDDILLTENAVSNIAGKIKTNDLVIWQSDICGTTMPSDENLKNKNIQVCGISGISFAFSAELLKYANWTPYKRGDYRVVSELNKNSKNVFWMKKKLTGTQNKKNGYGQKKDNGIKVPENIDLPETVIEKKEIKNKVIAYICKMPNGKMRQYNVNKHTKHLIKKGLLRIVEVIREK